VIWLWLIVAVWLVLAGLVLLYIAAATRRRDEEPHWPRGAA
jgi:bacteriorhodopsin